MTSDTIAAKGTPLCITAIQSPGPTRPIAGRSWGANTRTRAAQTARI